MVKITREAEIIVEDIGNTCIEAMNDNGILFYLIIRTNDIGWTKVLYYGPVNEAVGCPHECKCELNSFEYNEYKINKIIRSFLTDPKKRVTSAVEVDPYEIKDKLKDIKEYMYAN